MHSHVGMAVCCPEEVLFPGKTCPLLTTGKMLEPRSCGIFAALITSIGVTPGTEGQDAKRASIGLKKSVDVTGEFGQQTEKNERFLEYICSRLHVLLLASRTMR